MALVWATGMDESDNYYVELCKNPLRFDPVSKVTNVFFDDANKQVFAVRSGGATGVVVKGPDEKRSASFRMEDRGDVISIKFSWNMQVLAIQRSQRSVEFINYDGKLDTVEYSQTCRGKTTKIMGFNWTSLNEIVFITDHGIELYQVFPDKRSLKYMKSYGAQVNWFVWLPDVLLLSSGPHGNMIQPFYFKPGAMVKLPRFEVDLPTTPRPPKACLYERDVTLANLYGQLYIVVLRHQPRSTGTGGAEVVLYMLHRESPAKKTDVLILDMSGRFAINAVDNLLLVHHQASKTTMLFDIKGGGDSDGFVTYHHPVLSPLPIKPFKLQVQSVQGVGGVPQLAEVNCELYSPNWIVFQPNIIIDAKLGCLWYVHLKLEPLIKMLPDKCRLIDFLLLRKDSKMVVLKVCKQIVTPGTQAPLSVIAAIFDKLNHVYRLYQNTQAQALTGEQPAVTWYKNWTVIDQSEMYSYVFSSFEDNKDIKYKFIVAVMIEYIRSLSHYQIGVQHYLYELVINTLVHHNCFYQLHQFLQYHVIHDTKPLACLMLSLESVYPPAYQLALDMLKRLTTANEEIIEVLLSKQQLLPALRFIRSVGGVDCASARKFLEAAKNTQDSLLYYTVFKFFEQRNVRLRGSAKFAPGEHCDQYVKHFEDLFGKSTPGEAVNAQ